jgi:hypothetical protein
MAVELRDLEAEAEADKGTLGTKTMREEMNPPSSTPTSTSAGGACEEAVTPDAPLPLTEDRPLAVSTTKVSRLSWS